MSNGLSQEEINELRELRELLKRQQVQDDKDEPRSLPNEVRLEMEQAPPSQPKNKLRQYARNTSKYERDSWTKSETVNRVYLPELKNTTLMQCNTSMRSVREPTGLGQQLEEQQSFSQTSNKPWGTDVTKTPWKSSWKGLDAYQYTAGPQAKNWTEIKDASQFSIKALRLPDNLKYLEEDDDDEDKDYFFDTDTIEKIQRTRFENLIMRKQQGNYHQRGHQHGGFSKNKDSGKSFFSGKGKFRLKPKPIGNNQEQPRDSAKEQRGKHSPKTSLKQGESV
ncbi:uncharacterized protein RHIMIDRAFT_47096 [Rhizopus microsporus ATCC 52813]|uniref:Uncharacterized protein n=1 Tax=Rhizopus microsporus ATCC 52813 TaxID=1340429 RepID=A0A2G4SKW9_RHIZD|nr:uncharacterized protein RHIMIDRAFT_47096 [Rhizopus microsporus ATCC 52813]PHZ09420.1 hypothetical protein RHIMIDRAFT_47096 [Rhizopus microsporus ATCC 52813]